MINAFKRLLKRPKRMTIVISFVQGNDGKISTAIKFNRAIPVANAIDALDRLSREIKQGLTNKAHAKGLDYRNPRTRSFIKEQTINDVV